LYLAFSEYHAWGGKLTEPEYYRLEFAARMVIDQKTQGRLHDEEPVREVVKRLVFELVERGYCGTLDGKETTSVSEGGISVSYESKTGKAESIIREFLANETVDGVPVFYCGN
jgi:hypothetical protein